MTPRLSPKSREAFDTGLTLSAGIAVALILKLVVFQNFTIPSSSMEPGLQTGDYLVATKFDYGWRGAGVARGDVVVFRLPREPRVVYVKRVIGLPGDRVQVARGRVMVNGAAIPAREVGEGADHDAPHRRVMAVEERKASGETYVTFDAGPGHPGDDTRVFVVPAGRYFMMGDNRDNSLDSRWPGDVGVGFVPARNVLGKARVVLMSWKPGASVWKPWTWARLDGARAFKPVT